MGLGTGCEMLGTVIVDYDFEVLGGGRSVAGSYGGDGKYGG